MSIDRCSLEQLTYTADRRVWWTFMARVSIVSGEETAGLAEVLRVSSGRI